MPLAEAGADTIKFQTYKVDTLVTHWAPTYWEQNNGRKYKTQADCFQKGINLILKIIKC